MTKEPTLLIMAAGLGSRYGGLKQISPISGENEIILDFSLFDAIRAGFKRAVIVIKKEHENDFRALLDERAGRFINIEYAYQDIDDLPSGFETPAERTKPWGTGQAVLAARDLIDGPFAVINSDDYYGPSAFKEMYDFLASDEMTDDTYSMVGFPVENTLTDNGSVSRGVCQVSECGELVDIIERTHILKQGEVIGYSVDGGETYTEIPAGTPVSMNFWGFSASFMDETWTRFATFLDQVLNGEEGEQYAIGAINPLKSEYPLPMIVDRLLKEGKVCVKVLKSIDRWYGVTYKEDRDFVVNALYEKKLAGDYPMSLWG